MTRLFRRRGCSPATLVEPSFQPRPIRDISHRVASIMALQLQTTKCVDTVHPDWHGGSAHHISAARGVARHRGFRSMLTTARRFVAAAAAAAFVLIAASPAYPQAAKAPAGTPG